jgi:hypothetical protein
MGGLHGNFLCYAINSLDPNIRHTLPFTKFGTSHIPYTKTIAECDHYTHFMKPFKTRNIISIVCDIDDCLLVSLLCYGRAGDFNFDLKNFNVNFYDQVKGTTFESMIDLIDAAYGTNCKIDNSIHRGILREYFKFNFLDYTKNNIISKVYDQIYDFGVFEFNLKNFYDFDKFIYSLTKIVEHFNIGYSIDVEWYKEIWSEFIRNIKQLSEVNIAMATLDAIKLKQFKTIDFNLLQESWLNARLELIYNKEMPFMQDQYFSNTLEIIEYLKQ